MLETRILRTSARLLLTHCPALTLVLAVIGLLGIRSWVANAANPGVYLLLVVSGRSMLREIVPVNWPQ